MRNPRNYLMAAAILAASFVGGASAHWLLLPAPASAGDAKTRPTILKANGFVVTDQEGNMLALLGASPNGRASLALFDKGDAKPRVEICLTEHGPSVALADRKGMKRVDLGLSAKGAPALVQYDADGKIRGIFMTRDDGGIGLSLADAKGKSRVVLALAPTGEPVLKLYDDDGKIRAALGVPGGGPALYLYDGSRRTTWKTPEQAGK